MSDILDEVLNVDKDNRRIVLFRKIFPIIIISTVLIALAIGGYSWFLSKKTSQNQEIGDLLVQLIYNEYNKKDLNETLLDEIKIGRKNNVSDLAALKIVGNKIKHGDYASAMVSLNDVINNESTSEITKSYAKILYISLVLDIDKLSQDEENIVRQYFQSFDQESKAFYANATLLKSLFYLKNKQFDLAKKYSEEILSLQRASIVIKEQAKAIIAQIN